MKVDFSAGTWFHQGGFAMYILTLFSIVVIAITLEKVFYLARIYRNSADLKDAVRSGDMEKLKPHAKLLLYPLYARILEISLLGKNIQDSLRLLDRGIKRFEIRANRGTGWLATIGNTAPFVGLFGTVLGIIEAFTQLSAADPAAYGNVSAGISKALIATASGLVVAVPSVILYNYFLRRIINIVSAIRLDAEDFLEELIDKR
jgi:biopolymer transport protein ExbB/TolQ